MGGYEDEKISDGVYKVKFTGNAYTTIEQATDHALHRAEELCGSKNFEHDISGRTENAEGEIYYDFGAFPINYSHNFPVVEGTVTCK